MDFELRNYRTYSKGDLLAAWYFIPKSAREQISQPFRVEEYEQFFDELPSVTSGETDLNKLRLVYSFRDEGYDIDHLIKCARKYFGEVEDTTR